MGGCLFLLFGAMNCNKNKNEPVILLDKDFLSYFAFPVGSWWIYKEIKTGRKDSCFVELYSFEEKVSPKEGNIKNQLLHYHIASKIHPTILGFARPKGNSYYLFKDLEAGVNYFRYPWVVNKQKDGDDHFNMREHYDSIQINSVYYHDVLRTEFDYPDYGNTIKSEYYCKNVGVIKRIYFDSTTWELTKYFINK